MNEEGHALLSLITEANGRENLSATFRPFFWAHTVPDGAQDCATIEKLKGTNPLHWRIDFNKLEDYERVLSEARKAKLITEIVRPLEHQFLLNHSLRLFADMPFSSLKRCQLDIETGCSVEGGFSNSTRKEDRVLAIGLRSQGETTLLYLEENSDKGERDLLKRFGECLLALDPDVIEGHNIFKFDLEYLRRRCQRFKLPCAWGRFGALAEFRNSRLKVAERLIDFPRCDIPGRTVADTFFMIMMFDITARDLPSYSLKDVALYFGISKRNDRTYIKGDNIQNTFLNDRPTFSAYLADDLRETAEIAEILLPTYFAQTANFPMTLQEILLRGTGSKVDTLFLDKYAQGRAALPLPASVENYAGGFTKSFHEGVFKNVLHFDVASLYPSLLLLIDRNPNSDTLGVFIPMLKELRQYRLKYKKLARESTDTELKREYDARQASYKIIINSFYGYLGFEGARFADGPLAAEVTERGRDLLQALIEKFTSLGCQVLEADTDGIYLSSEAYYAQPEKLLETVLDVLPTGIDLEFDGAYPTMFCYKAKNYALYDGKRVIIRGSALRSRGTEPILKELTDTLIYHLLGVSTVKPESVLATLRQEVEGGKMDIRRLAKKEYLSQAPEKYKETLEKNGKPRRASLEVALRLNRPLKSGDQVIYYITKGEKKRSPDWQTARAIEEFNAETQPYDPAYYLEKLDDWAERYGEFLSGKAVQGSLF